MNHRTLNASQNLNILSLVSQLPNLGLFLLVKISRIYETVKKDLRSTVCYKTSRNIQAEDNNFTSFEKIVHLVQNLSSS